MGSGNAGDLGDAGNLGDGGRGIHGSGGGGAAPQAVAQPQVVAQLSLRGVGRGFVCWGPLGTPSPGLDRAMESRMRALWESHSALVT